MQHLETSEFHSQSQSQVDGINVFVETILPG